MPATESGSSSWTSGSDSSRGDSPAAFDHLTVTVCHYPPGASKWIKISDESMEQLSIWTHTPRSRWNYSLKPSVQG